MSGKLFYLGLTVALCKVTSTVESVEPSRISYSLPDHDFGDQSTAEDKAITLNLEARFAYPSKFKELKKMIGTQYSEISHIVIEIESTVTSIDELVDFIHTIKSRLPYEGGQGIIFVAENALRVTLITHVGCNLEKLWSDLDLMNRRNISLFTELNVYEFGSEDEITKSFTQQPLLNHTGHGAIDRTFVIKPEGGTVKTIIQIQGNSVIIEGKCPENFDFFRKVASSLPIERFELLISKTSVICDISQIETAQSTLKSITVIVNESITTLLDLSVASALPHLKSLSLRSDLIQPRLCPLKLPASLPYKIEFIEMTACQVYSSAAPETHQSSLTLINNITLLPIQIYADRKRSSWFRFEDNTVQGMKNIRFQNPDEEEIFILFPQEKQKLVDRLESAHLMKTKVKKVNIVLMPEFSSEGERILTEEALVGEISNLIHPWHWLQIFYKSYNKSKFADLPVTFICFDTEKLKFKFPKFKFEPILRFSNENIGFNFVLKNMDSSVYPIYFNFGITDQFLLRINTYVIFKGLCSSISELGKTSTVTKLDIIWSQGEVCDLRGLAKSAKDSSLKHLVVYSSGPIVSESKHHLILDGLQYLKTLDLSHHSYPVLHIAPPSEPFDSLQLLSFPNNEYQLASPIVIGGDTQRDIKINQATHPDSVSFSTPPSNEPFSKVSFSGGSTTSRLSYPISHIVVDDLNEIDRTSSTRNQTIKILTCKNDEIDLNLFIEVIGSLPNLLKGEIVMSNHKLLLIRDQFIHDKWRIEVSKTDLNNTYIFKRRTSQINSNL
jgi:hypothetical protein